jgi:ABC-type sulfate transport system permease subunit
MFAVPLLALFRPDLFPGSAVMALTLTAAIAIPTGFLFGLLVEWRAAKTSKKHG